MPLPETTQGQTTALGQWLQDFGTGKVLRIILREGVNDTATGIDGLHRLVVDLYAHAKTTGRIDVLRRKNANGYLTLRGYVYIVFQCSAAILGENIVATHTTIAAPKVRQEYPSCILSVRLAGESVGRNAIFRPLPASPEGEEQIA